MRSVLLASLVILAGCAKPEPSDQASASGQIGAGVTATPITLASVAGKWSMNVMSATSDSVLATFELVATGDPAGWVFNFPQVAAPVPLRLSAVEGDSIVSEAGPYQSILRKGVNVTVNSVMRMVDGKLAGTTVAHYATSGPDSVVHLRLSGTRVP